MGFGFGKYGGEMKVRLLGVLLIIVGFISVAVGISFISAATEENGKTVSPVSDTDEDVKPVAGVYYLSGDKDGKKIELFSDGTFEISGNQRQAYVLKVWHDMAITDEETGEITLKNIYFLGTNLDGGSKFSDKIEYSPENNTLEYKGGCYLLKD